MEFNIKNKNNFLIQILALVIISIITITFIVSYIHISMYKQYVKEDIQINKQEFFIKNKKRIHDKVKLIVKEINYNRSIVEKKSKKILKDRIKASLAICNFIYKQYKNRITNKEIIYKISEQLKILKFDEGQGYYLMYDNNTSYMYLHPLQKFENKYVGNYKDKKGNVLVDVYKKSLKQNKIGFSKIYITKFNNEDIQYPKIVAVSIFKPLNIVIGTGIYLDLIEKNTKQELLNKIRKLTISNINNDYVFILDIYNIDGGEKFAKVLLNQNRTKLVNELLSISMKDDNGFEFFRKVLKDINKNGESYTEYHYKKLNSKKVSNKLSYFYYDKKWKWLIGTGFYYDDLKDIILDIENKLKLYRTKTIYNSIKFVLFISIIIIIISVFISIRIDKTIKKYTKQLLENKEELNIVQNIAKIGSWKFCFETHEISWSDEIYKIFNMNLDEKALSKQELFKYMINEDIETFNQQYKEHLKNQLPYETIHKIVLKNNKVKWIKFIFSTIFDENKRALITNGIMQDITNNYVTRKELEDKKELLLEKEKLASMGEMIGNIAHQWRQPLSVISTVSTGILMKKEYNILKDEDLEKSCNIINENAQYLSDTINDFKNFIKGDRELKELNLEKNILSFYHLIEGSVKSNNINIIFDVSSNIVFKGYEHELIQCYMNIFNNAKDAFVENEIENKLLFISAKKTEQYISIIFMDNANGIPKGVIKKIFDPYFTTKHKSQGTGLGLNMTYKLITEGMNGNITALNKKYIYKNVEYTGAMFEIIIPNI